MTSIKQLESHTDASKEAIGQVLYGDDWRSTSYLIQLLHKMEDYFGSLAEAHPDDDFYTAQIGLEAAVNLVSGSYKVPVSDERFEIVQALYDATVNHFIADLSDDAIADLAYLGCITRFVADMRVHAVNKWIEETGPSETKFEALKLAKRDAKVVDLAVSNAADVLFPNQN